MPQSANPIRIEPPQEIPMPQPKTARKSVTLEELTAFLKEKGIHTVVDGVTFHHWSYSGFGGIYSVICKEGAERERYILASEAKFKRAADNPVVELTSYINGGEFGNLDETPDGVWRGSIRYSGTPAMRLSEKRQDPISGIQFVSSLNQIEAKRHYNRILQIVTGKG